MLIEEVFGISDRQYTELAVVFFDSISVLNLSFFWCKLPDGLIVGFEFCVFGVFETVLALSHIVSGKRC